MGLFDHFPYTNLHELNLGWLLKTMKELQTIVETFVHAESLKFSDPIEWNITTQYAKNTIVLDENGNAFLSKQPVPTGIQLNNEDYWLKIFDFINYQEVFDKNLTFNVELNTTQASAAYSIDDWLLLNNVLYKVTAAININDDFIIGTNITHFTVEDFIKAFMNWATSTINQYKDDVDASEAAYRNQLAQDIANTTASLQSQLNLAISGVTVDSEVINARLGADGVTYSTLGEAIRTQIGVLNNIVFRCGFYIDPDKFEQGAWENNAKVSTPIRIRYSDRIEVKAGDIIQASTNGLYYYVAIYSSTSSTTDIEHTGWINTSYVIKHDGYLTLNAANGSSWNESTNIIPSDYSMDVIIRKNPELLKLINTHNIVIIPPYDNYISYTRATNQLVIPMYTRIIYGNTQYENNADITVDCSGLGTSALVIIFDTSNNSFLAKAYSQLSDYLLNSRYIILFGIRNTANSTIIECNMPYLVDGKMFGVIEPLNFSRTYNGEKIFPKNYFNASPFMTTSYSGSDYTQNDIAIYNNYLIAAMNPDELWVYDLTTKQRIYTISVSIEHGNVIAVSNTKIDSTDLFPLLYSGYDGTINVIRVKSDASAEVTNTIKLTAAYGYYTSSVFDFDSGIIYTMGYGINSYDETNNYIIFTVSDLNNMTTNPDQSLTPATISTRNIDFFGTMQGAEFYNNRIYMATASTHSPYDPKVVSMDTNGNIVSTITDFPTELQSELEGLCIDNDIMYVSEYFKIFKLTFKN